MTKQTKTIAMVLGLGAIGYWIYTRNKAKKSLNPFSKSSSFDGEDFFNASGGKTSFPLCGERCDNGRCYVQVVDANNRSSFQAHRCSGTLSSQID